MKKPAIPNDEELRIATLKGLNILDTPPEERFDRITRIVKHTFGVPIALVSLVDTNRQWFKSCQGLSATETPRDISFCGHAILEDKILIIPDALDDPRFVDNPLVTEAPHIRFYAGVPLKANNGCRLGTLCIIDRKPRNLNEPELDCLRDMGALVEIELNSLGIVAATLTIKDNENRLRAIMDNVLDGIITINEQGIVESFNKSAEKIFGYAAQEVVGNNVKMLMPEPYHSQHDGYLHNFVTTGRKKIIGIGRQVIGQRKDGSTFPMDLAVSEMSLGGRRMFNGIVRDITERVKIELMKNEFVSTVSHELRTPLTSIRGSLGLVAGGVGGELPAQVKTLIDIAYKNSERLILLVNDILDMEKIESGKMEFQCRPVELIQLLKMALEGNRAYADQFEVSYELESKLTGTMVNVDANRMMQVMTNLLSNAAKFSPSGDKVIISVTGNGRHVCVAVKNHGSGIPEQFHKRIFQKFTQGDSSDTRKKGGTGLGLSITKAIVEQMGGKIGFDSQPDVLTTFFVEFPIWHETEAKENKRVLICEGDQVMAEMLRQSLEQAGLTADIACDATQTKQMLKQHSYAAMTLDMALPGQQADELLQELRSTTTASIPVVMLSDYAVEGCSNGSYFGVIDWISKPINREQFVKVLQQAVGQVSERPRVLHIEDDLDIFRVVNVIVGDFAELDCAPSIADARRMLKNNRYNLAILDLSLPDGSGMELLPALNGALPPIPVMVFSASDMVLEGLPGIKSALVKSRTNNEQLLATIKSLIEVK